MMPTATGSRHGAAPQRWSCGDPPSPGGRGMAALASAMGVSTTLALRRACRPSTRASALLDNGAGPSLHPEEHSEVESRGSTHSPPKVLPPDQVVTASHTTNVDSTHSDPSLLAARDPGQPFIARHLLAAGIDDPQQRSTDGSHQRFGPSPISGHGPQIALKGVRPPSSATSHPGIEVSTLPMRPFPCLGASPYLLRSHLSLAQRP